MLAIVMVHKHHEQPAFIKHPLYMKLLDMLGGHSEVVEVTHTNDKNIKNTYKVTEYKI